MSSKLGELALRSLPTRLKESALPVGFLEPHLPIAGATRCSLVAVKAAVLDLQM